MLTPKEDISNIPTGSHKKVAMVCDCGREVTLEIKKLKCQVSCGKCTWKPKDFWLAQWWGDLRLDPNQELPGEWAPNSHQVFRFLCRVCGKLYTSNLGRLTIGRAVTCGKCNDLPIDEVKEMTWGSLQLDPNQELPETLSLKSNKKFKFLCDCSRTPIISMWGVSSGNSKSCGSCGCQPVSYWTKQRWGTIRLVKEQPLPPEISKGSHQKLKFLCTACDRVFTASFKSITSGNTETCGKCSWKSKGFWVEQKWGRLKLDPDQYLPPDIAPQSLARLWFLCQCRPGKVVRKRLPFGYVASNGLLSCGCLKIGENEFSEENEVRKFVASLDPTTHPKSWDIEGSRMKYDVYIKDRKFAIEYHGLHWHSERLKDEMEAKLIKEGKLKDRTPPEKKDRKKYELACYQGDRLLQFYEDEWKLKQPIMMGMIQELVAPLPKIRIKPTFEVVLDKTPSEATEFLNQNHYLGADGGCLTLLAKHKDRVVGVWVFQKRETGTVLWHRACWDRKYKSWNPHEKALKMALPLLKDMGFTRMVTFSDNRFHTGTLYEKLGFTFEEEIRPSYFYTNERIRKTKFSFRVPAGVNEEEAARAKGWYRIYDSGKKRFSLTI